MRVHFTNLFGQSSRSVALIAQNDTMKIAKELGANELGIYFYDSSQEPDGELNSRFDGIVAGLSVGDIVFFSPQPVSTHVASMAMTMRRAVILYLFPFNI